MFVINKEDQGFNSVIVKLRLTVFREDKNETHRDIGLSDFVHRPEFS
jgi:hypothetical protein